jgi:Asp/Glu/hydantoin racemase
LRYLEEEESGGKSDFDKNCANKVENDGGEVIVTSCAGVLGIEIKLLWM